KAEVTAGLLPLSSHSSSSPPDWKGNPGLKDTTVQAVSDHVGELYLLPLYKPVNDGSADSSSYKAGDGNGSSYYYTIVQFVGIRISTADKKNVWVQPSAVIDPNAVLSGLQPASPPATSTQLITTFGAPKLTR